MGLKKRTQIHSVPTLSLIKILYWMCEKTNMLPTGPQLVHAIKRNFGGLKEARLNPEDIFREFLTMNIDEPPDMSNIDSHVKPLFITACLSFLITACLSFFVFFYLHIQMKPFLCPDNTQRGLIKTSLRTKETSWHGYEEIVYHFLQC